jgi:hypothetical protein
MFHIFVLGFMLTGYTVL